MDYNKVAKDILDNVGGKANVKQVTHCFTRLRFVLRDESKAKKEVVEHLLSEFSTAKKIRINSGTYVDARLLTLKCSCLTEYEDSD